MRSLDLLIEWNTEVVTFFEGMETAKNFCNEMGYYSSDIVVNGQRVVHKLRLYIFDTFFTLLPLVDSFTYDISLISSPIAAKFERNLWMTPKRTKRSFSYGICNCRLVTLFFRTASSHGKKINKCNVGRYTHYYLIHTQELILVCSWFSNSQMIS